MVDNVEMSRLQISRPAVKDKLYSLGIEQERVSCQVKESIRSLSVTNEDAMEQDIKALYTAGLACGWGLKAVIGWVSVEHQQWSL